MGFLRRETVKDPDTGDFARLASLFLGEDVTHAVEQVDIAAKSY